MDVTNITSTNIEYDEFNSAALLVTLLTIAALAIYGLRQNNFSLVGVSLALTPFLLIGIVTLGKNLFKSPASIYQASVSYWFFMGFARILNGVGDSASFSFYSTATDTYLSTAFTTASDKAQALTNGQLIPYVENAAIFGEIIVVYHLIVQTGFLQGLGLPNPVVKVIAFLIATTVGGLTFMALHGVRSQSFNLKAFMFMAVLSAILIGSDLGILVIPVIPVTFGGMFGFHKGMNVAEIGGFIEFYELLASFTEPVSFLVSGIFLFDFVTLIIAVGGTMYFGGIAVVKMLE